MRQLREIANEIMKKKFAGDPVRMSTELGFDLSYVRRTVGLAPSIGSKQQKTFEFSARILKLCDELGIDPDPAHELKKNNPHLTAKGIITSEQQHGKTTASDAKEGKTGTKTTGAGAISPCGNTLRKRKTR